MAKSLQEQLLGAGLVDNKKAKAIKQEQRKQKKQQPKGQAQPDQDKARLQAEKQAKIERDRELNQQRQQDLEKRAIQAQIKQLIEQNRITPEQDDVGYQFADGKKVQKIYVSDLLQNQLSKGQVSIAKLDDSYALIPNKVADKISQRDDSAIVPLNTDTTAVDEDDPYADYQIPDDLMW